MHSKYTEKTFNERQSQPTSKYLKTKLRKNGQYANISPMLQGTNGLVCARVGKNNDKPSSFHLHHSSHLETATQLKVLFRRDAFNLNAVAVGKSRAKSISQQRNCGVRGNWPDFARTNYLRDERGGRVLKTGFDFFLKQCQRIHSNTLPFITPPVPRVSNSNSAATLSLPVNARMNQNLSICLSLFSCLSVSLV